MIRSERLPSRVRDERGVVLLAVLIVIALLTIAVTEFTYNVQIDRHRAVNAVHALQSTLLARSAINIEESFLTLDTEPRFDAFTEEWWLLLREFCQGLQLEPTMRIACDLEDESGKININLSRTLIRTTGQQNEDERPTKDAFVRDALRRIFEAHGIDVDIPDRLKEYWLEEVPAEQNVRRRVPEFGSLEDFTARFDIPTPKLRRLRRILTAQPVRYMRAVNINTAPAEVLAALLNSPEAVTAVLERQQADDPFQNQSEVRSVLQEQGLDEDAQIVASLFDVRSQLFRLRASGVTNMDPSGELPGGVGQTLSVLVHRRVDARLRRPDSDNPGWTLKPLDWQKESGARLVEQPSGDFDRRDSFDELEELRGEYPGA